MKLTNKVALISGLGCLALVGTGFAAWVYNDGTVDSKAGNASVIAADKNSTSATITATVAGSVTLDQDVSKPGYVGMLTWAPAFSASATLTGDTHFNAADYTLTYAITIEAPLSDYITIKSGATGNWDHSGAAITGVSFEFNQTNVPDTVAKYNTMHDGIAGKHIVVTFSAAYSKNA
jgi:hypothetical protein